MDICGGGTVGVGATSISFTNDHNEDCTITSCTLPGWPTTDPVITAKSTQPVNLTQPATAGDYTYTPSCCRKRTNPVIKVQ
jgi:hypothetical protein